MKKLILFFSIFFVSLGLFSQVSNTNGPWRIQTEDTQLGRTVGPGEFVFDKTGKINYYLPTGGISTDSVSSISDRVDITNYWQKITDEYVYPSLYGGAFGLGNHASVYADSILTTVIDSDSALVTAGAVLDLVTASTVDLANFSFLHDSAFVDQTMYFEQFFDYDTTWNEDDDPPTYVSRTAGDTTIRFIGDEFIGNLYKTTTGNQYLQFVSDSNRTDLYSTFGISGVSRVRLNASGSSLRYEVGGEPAGILAGDQEVRISSNFESGTVPYEQFLVDHDTVLFSMQTIAIIDAASSKAAITKEWSAANKYVGTNDGVAEGQLLYWDTTTSKWNYANVFNFRWKTDSSRLFVTHIQSDTVSIGSEYILPFVDGTAGQVIETDGSGNLTFETPSTSTLWTAGSGTASLYPTGIDVGGITDNNYTTGLGKFGSSRFNDGTTQGFSHFAMWNETDSLFNPAKFEGGIENRGDTAVGYSEHADVLLNTIHRTSTGADHTYLDQAVTITASPTHADLTLTDDLTVADLVTFNGRAVMNDNMAQSSEEIISATTISKTNVYCTSAAVGAFDLTLPAFSSTTGNVYYIQNYSGWTVTLKPASGEVINEVADGSKVIADGATLRIQNSGIASVGWSTTGAVAR